MSAFEVNTTGVLESKRSFLCWRSRDFDDHYECSVIGTDELGARIEFEGEG